MQRFYKLLIMLQFLSLLRLRTIIGVIILWLLPLSSWAQPADKGFISGKILYKNGTPAANVVLVLQPLGVYEYTDDKGTFTMAAIPLGKEYNLEIRPFDYGNKPIIVKVNATQPHNKVIVKLERNEEISLSEVVVVQKNKGAQTKEKGFAMAVVNTKEASLKNLQTTELLGRTAGLKIRQTAGLGSELSYNLNGLTGNSVRIFIDGIPMRNYGRSFSLSSIPPSMIERIEIYKGVLPTELSEDALGGGINVVLKKEMRNTLVSSYSYGSFNTHQWDLNASFREQKTGITLGLSSFHNYTDNNYEVWGEGVYITDISTGRMKPIRAKRFHDSYYAMGLKGTLGVVHKKWADDFSVGFMFSQMQKDIQTGATMHIVYGDRRTYSHSRMANLQYRKNDLLLKGLNFKTYTTYSLVFRNVIDDSPYVYNWRGERMRNFDGSYMTRSQGGEAGNATRAENTEAGLSNRSQLSYRLAKAHTIGGTFFYEDFSRKIDDPLQSASVRNAMDKRNYGKHIWGANYEGKYFKNKLNTTFFYKSYHQSVSLTEVNERIHPVFGYMFSTKKYHRKANYQGYGAVLSYAITPKIAIAASAEKAIRMPSATELLGNTSDMVNANYTLKPERANNFNLSLNLSDFSYKKHTLGGEVTFFVRDIHDMITRGLPSITSNNFSYENLGKISSKGVDFELKYNFNKQLFINSNLSYNRAIFNLEFDEVGLRYFYYKNRLRNQPYFTSNTSVEYFFNKLFKTGDRASIDYNFNYTHPFYINWESLGSANKTMLPAQPLHDIGVSYTFANRRLTLSASAKNIFNIQVFDNYALQKPGRAFYGKLTYHIQ